MSLKKWFAEKWVDIGRKKKDGSYAQCGRSDTSKGKYPKCSFCKSSFYVKRAN